MFTLQSSLHTCKLSHLCRIRVNIAASKKENVKQEKYARIAHKCIYSSEASEMSSARNESGEWIRCVCVRMQCRHARHNLQKPLFLTVAEIWIRNVQITTIISNRK